MASRASQRLDLGNLYVDSDVAMASNPLSKSAKASRLAPRAANNALNSRLNPTTATTTATALTGAAASPGDGGVEEGSDSHVQYSGEDEDVDEPEADPRREGEVEVTVHSSCGWSAVSEQQNAPPPKMMHAFAATSFLLETPDPHFDLHVFLKHFIINFIGAPMAILAPGWSNYTIQGFGRPDGNVAFWVFNAVLPATVFISLFLYWGAPSYVESALGGSAYQCLLFYTMHRINVAMKYASLSPSEYQLFMQVDNINDGLKYHNQIQLLSSYINRSDELLDFEIASASVRNGIDVPKLFFTIESPASSPEALASFMHWQAFLLGQKDLRGISWLRVHADLKDVLVLDTAGNYRVAMFNFMKSLIRSAGEMPTGMGILTRINGAATLTNVLIPIFWTTISPSAKYDPGNPQSISFIGAYYAFSFIPGLLFYFLVFSFVTMALIDGRRKRWEAKVLGELIRFTDKRVGSIRTISMFPENMTRDNVAQTLRARRGTMHFSKAGKVSDFLDEGGRGGGDVLAVSETTVAVIPRLPAQARFSRHNILSWVAARSILRGLGERYKARLDFNLILLFIVNIMFLVAMFALSIAQAAGKSQAGIGLSSPIVLQTFVTAALLMIGLGSHIFVASRVNLIYDEHVGTIQGLAMKLEASVCSLREMRDLVAEKAEGDEDEKEDEDQGQEEGAGESQPQEAAKAASLRAKRETKREAAALCREINQQLDNLTSTHEALINAREHIQVTDNLRSFTVLGFPASYGLLSAYISLCGSAITTMAGIYMSVVSQTATLIPATKSPTPSPIW